MKLNCRLTRRQPCNCSENVKNSVKSSQPKPRSSARLYTPYQEKQQRHVTQIGLGNFVPPSCLYPSPGDLVEFDRKLYSHWAVFVGDGQVIHVSGEKSDIASRNVEVRQSSLAQVAGESHVRINNKSVPAKDRKLKPFEPRKIISNAKKCLGKTLLYDMFKNNAEHYVTLWRYGKAWSDQVNFAS